jgi:hypothetical protein
METFEDWDEKFEDQFNALGLTDANDFFFIGSSVTEWRRVRCGRPSAAQLWT